MIVYWLQTLTTKLKEVETNKAMENTNLYENVKIDFKYIKVRFCIMIFLAQWLHICVCLLQYKD